MKTKQKLGYEPSGVDLLPIQSAPLTVEEKQEISAYIAQRKKQYAASQQAVARRHARASGKSRQAA